MSYFADMFGDQAKNSFERKIRPLIAIGIMVSFLVLACNSEKPKGILSEQQMVKVLTEIYLMEEKSARSITPYDSLKKKFPKFSVKIFEKLHVSDSVFNESMEYYMAHPKKLEHIYAAVVDTLSLKAQSFPAENL